MIDPFKKGPKTGALFSLRLKLIFHFVTLLCVAHADAPAHLPPLVFCRHRAVVPPAAMGITGLLQELPGGDIKTSARVGFEKLGLLRDRPVDIDAGTLIYVCALRVSRAVAAGMICRGASEESAGGDGGRRRVRPRPRTRRTPSPPRTASRRRWVGGRLLQRRVGTTSRVVTVGPGDCGNDSGGDGGVGGAVHGPGGEKALAAYADASAAEVGGTASASAGRT